MNAILGISEIFLQNETPSANSEEGFRKIYESGSLLLNIINDILDFSKIEAGKLEIIPRKYDIPVFINDSVQVNRFRYESKPIKFILQFDENLPLEVIGDKLRIRQVLDNLLSNAYKYTDTGEVELSLSFEPGHDDETIMLIFKVRDTGQGLNQEQLDKLFSEYERFNMEINYGVSGTGLGLNITKRLIELMDGKISVESEVGKGSTFTVRIPQKKCGSAVCGKEVTGSLQEFTFSNKAIAKNEQIVQKYMSHNKILVVDDVDSNLYVAKGLLLPYGLDIETAKSGFEAIEKIKDGNNYDIVFMDHMMPKMNGMEAVKIIRSMGYTYPIVALTANAISGQEQKFLSNGFDGFIPKPIDLRELDVLLTRFIGDKAPETRNNQDQQKENINEKKKYFILDAENAIDVLNKLKTKLRNLNDEEMESYIVAVHGIKSSLTNINEKTLSDTAFKLEQAGVKRDAAVMMDETPVFVDKLQALIDNFKSAQTNSDSEMSKDDKVFLQEKLQKIITESENYNIKAVKAALTELNQKTWPREINEMIDEISLKILHGDFKNVISITQKFC